MNKTKPISDLGLVVALMAKGYRPFERVREPDSRRINFIFECDEYFDALCEDYYSGRLDVDALKYFTLLKEVKAGIYQLDQLEKLK